MKLYNTLTSNLEELNTREEGHVAMYVCGVTPYNYPHIGNARAVVAFDIIRRYLEYSGYEVKYIQNFTDIDDKIINKATDENVFWKTLPEKFIKIYFEEMDALNVKRATAYPLATENITEIVELVEKLISNGYAYVINGDVYYEVRKFSGYGKLSKRVLDEMESGSRVEVSDIKRDPLDFALWKSAKPGEPSWESPWGLGRPGWHIECSAMSQKYLGNDFDIHGGGQDLIFPHHENEIAQSEGAMIGEGRLARYWMHNGFVTINHEKMSKSLGNFFTVREVLEKYPAEVVRYFLTSAHYRSPLDFSDQALDQAKSAYDRLRTGLFNITRILNDKRNGKPVDLNDTESILLKADTDFKDAMDDDFNTPKAIAVLFDLISTANKLMAQPGFLPDNNVKKLLSDVKDKVINLAGVLGIIISVENIQGDELTPQLMDLIIELRAVARKDKNYAMADIIRNRLTELNITLEDTPQGTVWRGK
jgi:cysteinyl-tRNA synthetase